jgi:hypothetical protein
MAKKPSPPEPPAAPARNKSSITLAAAIRQSLADLGVEASKPDVSGWIKAHHPSLEVKDGTLNSSLSSIRKKLRGDARTGSRSEPTVHELMRVKDLAAERGGVDELLALVNQVGGLAEKFGGLHRLRECLEAMKKLTS